MNIAQLLGPLVGGALHQAGGFYLPFVTMGSLQFTVGFLALFLLTEPNMSKFSLMSSFIIDTVHTRNVSLIMYYTFEYISNYICTPQK